MTGATAVVWCAGVEWDGPAGTDRRLVEEIAAVRTVHWIDPPRFTRRSSSPETTEVPGVVRHRVWAPPGSTRAPIAPITRMLRDAAVGDVVRLTGADTIVVANPLGGFPAAPARRRVLFITDDWEAGAALMGLSRALIGRSVAAARTIADRVVVVSPALVQGTDDVVLPNGGPEPTSLPEHAGDAVAVLIGQLNERLDLGALEAVTRAGVRVRVIGRRAVRDAHFARRLDAWLGGPLVEQLGPMPAAELPAHLVRCAVGLTPYVSTEFNQASSPLKTFDYLAAGLPVVSTALPASRWLDTDHVVVTDDAASFARAVTDAIGSRDDRSRTQARLTLAAEHTWARRAHTFLARIDDVAPVVQGGRT